jgi:CysZ protein
MKTLLPQTLSGPAYLLRGFRSLTKPGLRRYVVFPALGNLVIYTIAGVAIFYGLDSALDRWLPQGYDWLRWLLFPIVALVLFAVGMLLFTLLTNLLLSPFLGTLSAHVEAQLGNAPEPPPRPFWPGLRADLGLELRRMAYILLCLLGVFAASLIPVVNFVVAPFGLLVTAWLLAVEYAGNPLGNRRWTLREQLQFLRGARWRMIAFGLASFGLTLVPIINLVVVPASVIGMTLLCRDLIGPPPAAA